MKKPSRDSLAATVERWRKVAYERDA